MGTRYSLDLPAAQILLTSGHYVHLYAGAPIPKDVAPGVLDHLLLLEAVTEWDDGVEDVVVPVDTGEPEVTDDGEPVAPGSVTSKPPQVASKGQWVEWAVFKGADRASAEALTKADLVREFGS